MKTDVPTFRQAAELMDDGRAREAVFKFAREHYDKCRGELSDVAIKDLRRVLDLQQRVHEKQARDPEPQMPAGMREFLRAHGLVERFLRWSDNAWEAAFRVARNRLRKELGIEPPALRWLVDDTPASTRTTAARAEPDEMSLIRMSIDADGAKAGLNEAQLRFDEAEYARQTATAPAQAAGEPSATPPVTSAHKKSHSPYRKPKIRKGALVW